MTTKPGQPADLSKPDPADPLSNPAPVPGRASAELGPRQPNEPPAETVASEAAPNCPKMPPAHPLGAPEPQAAL